jgi:hypothetical protein
VVIRIIVKGVFAAVALLALSSERTPREQAVSVWVDNSWRAFSFLPRGPRRETLSWPVGVFRK